MLDQCILLLVVVAGYRKDFILNLFAARLNLRHKIKGTTMAPWWAELEVTRRHLARIQVPALPWPPAASALLCCNM